MEGKQVEYSTASLLLLWMSNHQANKRSEEQHWFGLSAGIIEDFRFYCAT